MTGILELKIMARERGVKCFSSMSKKKLYEAMGMEEPARPTKVKLTNRDTGEIMKFPSAYEAAKKLGIRAGVFYNYTNRARVGNVIYDVELFNRTKRTRKD